MYCSKVLCGLAVGLTIVASSATAHAEVLTVMAVGMATRNNTHHNNATTTVCPARAPSHSGGETNGVLVDTPGGLMWPVNLPQGATVTKLTLYARDTSATYDVFGWLMAKRIIVGNPITSGHSSMAKVQSTGASANPNIRSFVDNTISLAVIDNTAYGYYLELMNCDPVLEPVALRIEYTP